MQCMCMILHDNLFVTNGTGGLRRRDGTSDHTIVFNVSAYLNMQVSNIVVEW